VTPLDESSHVVANVALNARRAFRPSVAEAARNRTSLQVGKSNEGPERSMPEHVGNDG
jgi:hypothetical protein